MKNNHVSDYDIQQFVLADAICDHSITQHVRTCQDCSRRAATYRLIFATLEKQARPTFECDLTGIVLSKIEATEKVHISSNWLNYFIIAIIAVPIAITSYMFGEGLPNMLSGLSTISLFLLFATAATLLAFQIDDMIKEHKKHMSDLEIAKHL